MCFNCNRKTAALIASLLATGTADVSEYPEEEQEREARAARDAATLIQIGRARWRTDPDQLTEEEIDALASEQVEAIKNLYNDIGGARLADAAHLLCYFMQAALEGATITMLMFDALGETNPESPADKAAAIIKRTLGGTAQRLAKAIVPPHVAELIDGLVTGRTQIAKAGTLSLGTRAPDKPVGTGPNGEVH